jgi:putative membrane protein
MWCNWNTMSIFGWTTMILLWGGLVALAVWAIRSVGSANRDRASDALGILERRFAAGEIDRDEFEQRRRLLEESRGARS